ncbi:MAG: hypothetical protein F4Y88_09700 [Chloroflexi bacterium]|nr:hypothetical protein [Chloroflexota bacterium]
MELIEAWRNTRFRQPPYVFEADVPIIKSSPRAKDLGIIGKSCHEVEAHPDYCPEKSIHFSLLPQPFNGDLLNAEVYVLTLNPGFACSDYDANYRNPRYRQALLDNIRQDQPKDVLPFYFLDPKFDCHGGYGYWFCKLRETITRISECTGMTFGDARNKLGRKLAVIEIFPYHSKRASGLGSLPRQLPSSKLAKQFVKCHVLKKVERCEAIVIGLRQSDRARPDQLWSQVLGDRGECKGIHRYTSGQARRASFSLGAKGPGGRAIVDWAIKRWKP